MAWTRGSRQVRVENDGGGAQGEVQRSRCPDRRVPAGVGTALALRGPALRPAGTRVQATRVLQLGSQGRGWGPLCVSPLGQRPGHGKPSLRVTCADADKLCCPGRTASSVVGPALWMWDCESLLLTAVQGLVLLSTLAWRPAAPPTAQGHVPSAARGGPCPAQPAPGCPRPGERT